MSQATPCDPYPKTQQSASSMSQDTEKKVSFLRTNKVEITTACVILVLGVGLGLGLPDQSMPHRFNRIITVMLKDVDSSIIEAAPDTWTFSWPHVNADIWLAVLLYLESEFLSSVLAELAHKERCGTFIGLCFLECNGFHGLLHFQRRLFL